MGCRRHSIPSHSKCLQRFCLLNWLLHVSVIIPTYNRATRVTGAVESALEQTYDDLEVVVIVDGSTDGTLETLREYEHNPRVTILVNESNLGHSLARNRGIAEAQGELICPLDDDDRWHREKVETQVARFDDVTDSVGVIYTGGIVYSGERRIADLWPSRRGTLYPNILTEFGLSPHSSHMVRRDAYESVGGFDPVFERGADWDVCIRISREFEFEYIDEPLTYVYRHDDNLTGISENDLRVRELIWDKYREELRRHPTSEHQFQGLWALARARNALNHGQHRSAIQHTVQAVRISPTERVIRRAIATWLPPSVTRHVNRLLRRLALVLLHGGPIIIDLTRSSSLIICT